MKFFGFAFSASMLPAGEVELKKVDLTVDQVRKLVSDCDICLNPSHKATIKAVREGLGISIEIPDQPPRIQLMTGDSIIVMQTFGLPRLTDRHEYTKEEIAKADFAFMEIKIVSVRKPTTAKLDPAVFPHRV